MALPATMRRFEIALADADRGVYEQLSWRVAQHPSESDRYLVARVLARALEHAEGLEFSKGGVSDDEEPALVQRDLRGDWVAWIEIGSPSPERLHKASKVAPRVVVYTWKAEQLVAALAGARLHRAPEIVALPLELVDAIVATLDRNNAWELAVTGGIVYLAAAGKQLEGAVQRLATGA
jgi:uncharacterized protein YaeQ